MDRAHACGISAFTGKLLAKAGASLAGHGVDVSSRDSNDVYIYIYVYIFYVNASLICIYIYIYIFIYNTNKKICAYVYIYIYIICSTLGP